MVIICTEESGIYSAPFTQLPSSRHHTIVNFTLNLAMYIEESTLSLNIYILISSHSRRKLIGRLPIFSFQQ